MAYNRAVAKIARTHAERMKSPAKTASRARKDEVQEILDLGNGIAFATVRENGRPSGNAVGTRTHNVPRFLIVRIDRKIARTTGYPDVDEARAGAKRLAEEQG